MTDAFDERLAALSAWVRERHPDQTWRFETASADASFRRYFRAVGSRQTWIVMDAPPDREPTGPFVHVAGLLARWQVAAPRVHAAHPAGFLLLDDLGDQTLLDRLDGSAAEGLLGEAMDALIALHRRAAHDPDTARLPAYDHDALMREMALLPRWYLGAHHDVDLAPEAREQLDTMLTHIAEVVGGQPRGFVHRDYHSRNLMVADGRLAGMLDFQDAMHGPLVYDVVSLLRDCYVVWPQAVQDAQLQRWARAMAQAGIWPDDAGATARWYDYTGLQRHLKVLGIFCRLHHRDGKSRYLADLPRVRAYVDDVVSRHDALAPLGTLLARHVPVEP